MPKPKAKATAGKKASPRAAKKVKVELSEPVCKEEDLVGIGGEAATIDLTDKKGKKVKKEFPGKKDASSDDGSDSDSSDDWFEKYFIVKEKGNKKAVPKGSVIEETIKDEDDDDIPDDDEEEEDVATDDSFNKYFETSKKGERTKEEDDPDKPRRKRVKLDYSMVKHLKGYKVKSKIYCSICDEHFNTMPGHPQNFNDHILKVHAHRVGNDLYQCTFCDNKTPKSLKNLKMHLFRHREMAKPKVCSVCGETFWEYNKWRTHVRMEKGVTGGHSEKNCYPCEACGKFFSSKHSLTMHIVTVHEKKGRNCRWCPRVVPLDEWEEHKAMEKIKHGVRVPTTCDVCGATFTSKDSAANHRRNFHRNIVLQCPLCPKTFNSSTALSQHKAFKHIEKRFECTYCNKKYAYRYEAKQHITKKHKIQKDEISDDAVIEHKASDIPEYRERNSSNVGANMQIAIEYVILPDSM